MIIIILSGIMFVWIDRLHNICSETPICKARWLYLQFCHKLHSVLWPLVSHLRFSMTSNTINFTVITKNNYSIRPFLSPTPTPPCLARFSHDAPTPPPFVTRDCITNIEPISCYFYLAQKLCFWRGIIFIGVYLSVCVSVCLTRY